MHILFNANDKSKKDLYEAGFKLNNNDIHFVSSDSQEDYVTVSVNESLYIDGLSDDNQPGENYKMVKVLGEDGSTSYESASDDKIVSYYASLVGELGGTAKAKFIDNVKVDYKGKTIKEFKVENPAIFTSNASKIIKKGSPLSSITLIPEFGDIHKSECDDNEEELLFETRDKKAINTIAKEVSGINDIIMQMNNTNKDNDTNDFLHNEVKM